MIRGTALSNHGICILRQCIEEALKSGMRLKTALKVVCSFCTINGEVYHLNDDVYD